ncbi:MAG: hypothetical protein KGI33_02760 [Thaumarchaeota archaeon]|nr:hypothetical protein [Nitrososphaerota archaeon]
MHKQVITGAIIATLALTLVGIGPSVYALSGHGMSYAPSFGSMAIGSVLGGSGFSYNDGLTINGDTFDVSNYVQKIPTETVYVGAPTTITTKLWEYGGTWQIQGVAMFLNVRGHDPSPSQSDTWVQYSKVTGVTVHDPNNILGNVTASVKYDQKFMYVTFHFTPQNPMKTSWIILTAWDNQLSIGTAKVENGLNISYVPFSYH